MGRDFWAWVSCIAKKSGFFGGFFQAFLLESLWLRLKLLELRLLRRFISCLAPKSFFSDVLHPPSCCGSTDLETTEEISNLKLACVKKTIVPCPSRSRSDEISPPPVFFRREKNGIQLVSQPLTQKTWLRSEFPWHHGFPCKTGAN